MPPSTPGTGGQATAIKIERARVQAELQVKQEGFVRKERAFKSKIEEQQSELGHIRSGRTSWMDEDESFTSIRKVHKDIQAKIGQVQVRAGRQVQEQEQELLKAFKQRLADLQGELDRERASNAGGGSGGDEDGNGGGGGEGSIAGGESIDGGGGGEEDCRTVMSTESGWVAKTRKLELKVDDQRNRADREDRRHKALLVENQRLKVQAALQADDKRRLVQQLVAVKQHNAGLADQRPALTEELASLRAELGEAKQMDRFYQQARGHQPQGSTSAPSPARGTPGGGDGDGAAGEGGMAQGDGCGGRLAWQPRQIAEGRFQEVLKKLSRMLTAERKAELGVAASLAEHRSSVSALERSLKACVDAVAQEAAHAPSKERKQRTRPDGDGEDDWSSLAPSSTPSEDDGGGGGGGGGDDDDDDDATVTALGLTEEALRARRVATLRGGLPIEALTAAERERALERWLNAEGTVEALTHNARGGGGGGGRTGGRPTSTPKLPPI